MFDIDNSEFTLGPCRLYVGDSTASADALRSDVCFAGVTDGGCTLAYRSVSHEIKNEHGEVVGVLRAGQRLVISGRFAYLRPAATARICGCTLNGDSIDAASGNGLKQIGVVLVSDLPDGDELVVSAKCSPSGNGDLRFDCNRGGGISFELSTVASTGTLRFKANAN